MTKYETILESKLGMTQMFLFLSMATNVLLFIWLLMKEGVL